MCIVKKSQREDKAEVISAGTLAMAVQILSKIEIRETASGNVGQDELVRASARGMDSRVLLIEVRDCETWEAVKVVRTESWRTRGN